MKHMIVSENCPEEKRKELFSKVGKSVVDFLVEAKFSKSKSDARRSIEQGGVKLHGITIKNPMARIALENDEWILLE